MKRSRIASIATSILETMYNHHSPETSISVRELSEEYGIPTRTIRAGIASLVRAGYPLVKTPDRRFYVTHSVADMEIEVSKLFHLSDEVRGRALALDALARQYKERATMFRYPQNSGNVEEV